MTTGATGASTDAPAGPIDRAALDTQTGGDADLAREVLALFAGQCRALMPRLADPARPAPERADLAHTLKGSAAGVGAARVRALSGEAEAALRAGGAPALGSLAAAVAAALAAIEGEAAGRGA